MIERTARQLTAFRSRYIEGIGSGVWLWLAVLIAIALKMALVSDLAVYIQYNPQDDGLYAARAYHLLREGWFGPYDARTLVKLPGMSFWLAGARLLNLPYLWSMNVLYVLAGCYFLAGALQCGVGRRLAFAAFVVYLFNPVTMGGEWLRVIREPLSTGLIIVLFSSALFVLRRLESADRPWGHLAIFSLTFAFLPLLREDDAVLYVVPVAMGIAGWWLVRRAGTAHRVFVLSVVAVPLLMAGAANAATRQFVDRHYGLPLLHDYSEGEFPKLMAAMRRIESRKDNRYVMVTRERMAKLLVEVPRLGPVISRLPLPGPGTASCERYKVCSETANGWMPFWIKDAAWEAGLTPTLPKAQEFFRTAREDIERACAEGRLKCTAPENGLLPPFQVRWTRAYLQELLSLVALTAAPDPFLLQTHRERYNVDPSFARMVQFVTMTEAAAPGAPTQASRLASWRATIGGIYRFVAPVIVLLSAAAFVVRLLWWRQFPPDAPSLLAAVFAAYVVLRLAALAYVSVYLGRFDDRILYATHSFLLMIGLFLVADAMNAVRNRRASIG